MNIDPLRIKIKKWMAGALLPEEEKDVIKQLDALPNQDLEKLFKKEEWDATGAMAVDEDRMQRTLNNVRQHIAAETRISNNRRRMRTLMACAAGLVTVAVCITLLFTGTSKLFLSGIKDEKDIWTTVATVEGERKAIYLANGTKLSLNGGSVLKVPNMSGKNREVQLIKGELFLDVKQDNRRPFMVLTGKMTIRVLGTSFNVRNYKEEESVSVSVKSGKVAVDIQGSSQQVILTRRILYMPITPARCFRQEALVPALPAHSSRLKPSVILLVATWKVTPLTGAPTQMQASG